MAACFGGAKGTDPTYSDASRFEGDKCMEHLDCAGGTVGCYNGVCSKENPEEEGGGAGGGDGIPPKIATGFWVRVESAQNIETFIAFDSIRDESDTRVIMCELPPSPSAGLYKGTIDRSAEMITWETKLNEQTKVDEPISLPQYKVHGLEGDKMTFIPQTGQQVFLGKYAHGQWKPGACDYFPVENEVGKSKWTAWGEAQNARGYQVKSVKVDGYDIPTSVSPAPNCTAAKLPPAKRSGVRDVAINVDVNGANQNVQTTVLQSSLADGCNRFAISTGSQCSGGAAACATVGDPLPGPTPELLLGNLNSASGLGVTPTSLYAVETTSNSPLLRCPLSGCTGAPTQISVSGSLYSYVFDAETLFAATGQGVMTCTPASGSCALTAFSPTTSSVTSQSVAIGNGRVYWLEYAGPSPGTISVRVCPLSGCSTGYPKTIHSEAAKGGAPQVVVASGGLYFAYAEELIWLPLTGPETVNAAARIVLFTFTGTGCRVTGIDADDATSTLWWSESCSGTTVVRSCGLPTCEYGTERNRISGKDWRGIAVNATHVYGYVDSAPGAPFQYAEVWRFAR